jgi:hypothetical protein
MILPSTYIWKYHTEILELQRDAWKRNRSVVCAWKYHTEILELQRDAWKRNRSVVCAWKHYINIINPNKIWVKFGLI